MLEAEVAEPEEQEELAAGSAKRLTLFILYNVYIMLYLLCTCCKISGTNRI